MKKLFTGLLVVASLSGYAQSYVGSFRVGDGPCWPSAPVCYTAQEAAALIFGGNPSDYSISTNSSTTNPLTITHTAWIDGYGDSRYFFNAAPENYKLNTLYNYPAFSAFVNDHSGSPISPCSKAAAYINYVWRTLPFATGVPGRLIACEGAALTVPYTGGVAVNPGNTFTAQLSNATGSFASPVAIGSISATTAGTINATIPVNTAAGTGYRIRVVSSNPVQTANDNGADLTVIANTLSTTVSVSPAYTISGQEIQTIYLNYPGAGTTETLATGNINGGISPYTYAWSRLGCGAANATTINGANAATYQFTATTADVCSGNGNNDNIYTFTGIVTDVYGCIATASKKINVVNSFTDVAMANVQICHKVAVRGGSVTQLMTVPQSQVAVHLSHGDGLGNCPVFNGNKSVTELDELQKVAVYPNPSTGMFILELTTVTEQANILVTDVQGRIVAMKTLNKEDVPTATFDLSSFSKGLYLIQLRDGEYSYHTKIVVQ